MLRLPLSLVLFVSLAACGNLVSSSTRQVLPTFDAREMLKKRVLLAPYALATLSEEGGPPLAVADVQVLALDYPDPNPAFTALKAFYFAGAFPEQGSTTKDGGGLALVTIDAPRWQQYFENPEQFLSVTVDGQSRYQVPSRELLQRVGSDTDVAIVVSSLAYQININTGNSAIAGSGGRTVSCDASFLVWDYEGKRVLAEGKVNSLKRSTREGDVADFRSLGAYVVAEIIAKRPFR